MPTYDIREVADFVTESPTWIQLSRNLLELAGRNTNIGGHAKHLELNLKDGADLGRFRRQAVKPSLPIFRRIFPDFA